MKYVHIDKGDYSPLCELFLFSPAVCSWPQNEMFWCNGVSPPPTSSPTLHEFPSSEIWLLHWGFRNNTFSMLLPQTIMYVVKFLCFTSGVMVCWLYTMLTHGCCYVYTIKLLYFHIWNAGCFFFVFYSTQDSPFTKCRYGTVSPTQTHCTTCLVTMPTVILLPRFQFCLGSWYTPIISCFLMKFFKCIIDF